MRLERRPWYFAEPWRTGRSSAKPGAPTRPRSTISAASTTADRSRCWSPPRPRRVVSSIAPNSKRMNFETSSRSASGCAQIPAGRAQFGRPGAIAMQAISAPDCLPGLEAENPNPFVPDGSQARVWIGNQVTVAPHFDVAENIACVVAGRRRFILFPPEQTANLYPGPMDVTPANVPISMAPMDDSELDRFPRYREALRGRARRRPRARRRNLHPLFVVARRPVAGPLQHPGELLVQPRRSGRAIPLRAAAAPRAPRLSRHDAGASHCVARALRPLCLPDGGDPMDALAATHHEAIGPIDAETIARFRQALRELLG